LAAVSSWAVTPAATRRASPERLSTQGLIEIKMVDPPPM
jgi:hypothetical protein